MTRLVMKFGGTSVEDLPRIRNVAAHVAREVASGQKVAVVVSAMAGVTNRLVGWCQEASARYDPREYDSVVATGEQVTAGLLAIILQSQGIGARSWQGWQIPLQTDGAHGNARILGVNADSLLDEMDKNRVAVVTGFQGIGPDGRVSTLGRGGSDTSAVALAAALGARCDIYTDVDGVYTADPRITDRARKVPVISYEEMLEMASLGSKVLHPRSVELAMEIVEHIPDPKAFLTVCTQLLSPGGGLFVGTLNRTFKSFLLGIVAAEYLLGWLPKGTHQWERFLPPETIKEWLAADGLHLLDQTGIICSPLTFAWSLSKDQDVNYILSFQKPVPTGEEGSSSR